ncbi:MLO-like protein 12 [Hibiscus syriacus]|uniref:MLO-like protein 12 n=1 Tax=Hibiscus syriacus TaxID=106335 RepID=UPI001924596C|nr:MLO-like protein 12 [Hibiscus syriacus]
MADADNKARSLEETPTWAVAVVCFVIVIVSIFMEHGIHLLGKWLKKKHKPALYEALEKVKAELMLMGFISLLLTVLKDTIAGFCIPKTVADSWHPCDKKSTDKYPSKEMDHCKKKGQVAFVSTYGIHQLHIFIFVLAVSHILYCIITYALGSTKMKKWKAWESETKTVEYQYYNDPERFRFARDTSFGRRHLNFWTRSSLTLWIACFFRQFFGSVTKVDYLTLRHGFIMAHLARENETKFDFHKYIKRSLEDDFKVVVGISPIIWFIAVLFLLAYTHGWKSYFWLPFIPLVIILMVGTKLQVIITKLGLKIQERGDVVKGAPVVEPGDDLFWFGRPRFLLLLIHIVLFTNAFQLAFFVWSTYEFTINSCYHERIEDIIIRISMGIIIQVLCSYVTLPLYALVNQMGTNMRPTIFNERVAGALKSWHHTAKKQIKHNRHSENTTPFSSRPATPTHGMSPIHLLHSHPERSVENRNPSPTHLDFENDQWDPADKFANSPNHHEIDVLDIDQGRSHLETRGAGDMTVQDSSTSEMVSRSPRSARTQHAIDVSSSKNFSFAKR